MENLRKLFVLPFLPLIVLYILYFVVEQLLKHGVVDFILWDYESDKDFENYTKSLSNKIAPFKYAFSTIVWILIVDKYII